MNDQASALRASILQPRKPGTSRGQTIVLLGGKGGVGTTSLAVSLAVAMTRKNRRVCLFDADPSRFDVAYLAGLADGALPRERLAGRDDWYQHVPRTDAGMGVASATQFLAPDPQYHGASALHLPRRLCHGGHPFDVVLVDVGCQHTAIVRAWCEIADQVAVVTAQETVAFLNSYALLKRLSAWGMENQVGILFNQVVNDEEVDRCQQRLRESSLRFLGRSVSVLGKIPFDPHFRDSEFAGRPLLLSSPRAPAAAAIESVAERLIHSSGRSHPVRHDGSRDELCMHA